MGGWRDRLVERSTAERVPNVPKSPKYPASPNFGDFGNFGTRLAKEKTGAEVHFGDFGNFGTAPRIAEPDPERAAILADDGGIPPAFAEPFASLMATCPPGVPEARWRRAVDDAGVFLDQWGDVSADLGWTAGDLFDLAATGCSGLAWEMADREVVALTADCAVLGPDDRSERAYFGRPVKTGASE